MSEKTKELELGEAILDAHFLEKQRDYLLDLIFRMGAVTAEEEIAPMRPFFIELSRMIKEGMLYQEHHVYKDAIVSEE